jgi:alpha-L-arabinofuranosidase
MSSYAPLFFHVNDNAWPVNMIGFDNQSVFGRTSYWVNRMMAGNRPDILLNMLSTDSVENLFCIAGYDKEANEIVLKIVNTGAVPQKASFRFKGVRFTGQTATSILLTHADFNAENSRYNPEVVVPQIGQFKVGKEGIEREFAPWSFTILRVKTTKNK